MRTIRLPNFVAVQGEHRNAGLSAEVAKRGAVDSA